MESHDGGKGVVMHELCSEKAKDVTYNGRGVCCQRRQDGCDHTGVKVQCRQE